MSAALGLGALAAFGSSVTWAFSSTRYARASRAVGSARVNLARATLVLPIYLSVSLACSGMGAFAGVDAGHAVWMLVSVLCSYALADNLFFAAARRVGVSTALSIASSYPLWAALAGALLRGERFGPLRAIGTLVCVSGVIALARLHATRSSSERRRTGAGGILLALVTSLLWAGNSFSIKEASRGLGIWPLNAVRYAIAFTLLAAQVALGRASGVERAPAPPGGWLGLAPAILVDALLGSLLYVYGLGHTDLAIGATLSSLAPLVSVPFAVALGEETWDPARFAAITVTLLGVLVLVTA